MLNHQQVRNGLVDAALLLAFLAEFYRNLTGLELHQWIGLLIGLGAGYHLVTHWRWVEAVVGRFLKPLPGRARWYALLDAALLIGLVLIIETGIILSSWLNLPLANDAAWSAFHTAASITTLALLVAKLVLHWRWIVKTAAGLFAPAAPALAAVSAAGAQPQGARRGGGSRRHFLMVAGLTSLAALLSVRQVLAGSAQETSTSGAAAASSDSSASASSGALSSASSGAAACRLRCNRRCSYPGQCRRYTDSSGNGRCDLGECL